MGLGNETVALRFHFNEPVQADSVVEVQFHLIPVDQINGNVRDLTEHEPRTHQFASAAGPPQVLGWLPLSSFWPTPYRQPRDQRSLDP